MRFFTFQDFTNVFKKRYKMFVTIFIALMLLSFYANNTFLKDKLDQKYKVIFDYKFFYSWTTNSKNSIKFNDLTEKYEYFPFENLKEFHANYFELIYNFNIDDLKIKNVEKNKYYKIAKSFHFDTPNFTYPNRRLTLIWDNAEDAEEYLNNLHKKAKKELKIVTQTFYDKEYYTTLNNLNEFLLTFHPKVIGEEIKNKFKLNDQAELEEYVKNFIFEIKKNTKVDDDFFLRLVLSKTEMTRNLDVFFKDSAIMLYYYYLGNKYSGLDELGSKNIVLMSDLSNFIENLDEFLPKFRYSYTTVNTSYIYYIEVLLALLLSFLIVFTLHLKDNED